MSHCPVCASPLPAAATVCPVCGAPVSLGVQLPAGTALAAGRYVLEATLGQGGFGITYRARDTLLGRPVAVKELFPDGSSRVGTGVIPPGSLGPGGFREARERFLDEARTLARFDHPGIVRVWDAFEGGGTAYLAMEFLEGETLGGRLARGPLRPEEGLSVARDLLGALEVVHAAGVLHRDLKPDNVFLTRGGRRVLIDFGSARAFESGQARTHTRLVTPGYAPPEQYATSARFGPYTDLYALGATLYHALSGQAPPAATDRLLGVALPPLPASVPPGLRALVERTLAVAVAERPASVAAARALLGEPAAAVATPPAPDLSQPIRPPGGNLLRALQAAPDGATLRLAPGKFALPAPLTLTRPVRLVGSGAQQTRIVCEAPTYVLLVQARGVIFEDLRVDHGGRMAADVVVVQDGDLTLRGCELGGGVQATDGSAGNGLALLSAAQVRARDLISSGNGGSGVHLEGRARLDLEGGRLERNGSCGAVFFEATGGCLRGVSVIRNAVHGVAVAGQADPLLEENTLEDNRECGLAYLEQGGGEAVRNTVRGNGLHGIYVVQTARPVLRENRGSLVRESGSA
ncbi:hypothetical protein HNR42_002084 [Deinobacterium chartae]|uniref:Protein kinase domain-containing protein n=1 Tax=Deinobacterium chartae TaxID=521158 RepID=A0A841I2P2_9DEIO|nr:protein kinase [Deinobacterium chartae]MBB6098649.1 hypothetical protein [Deinobacterium chartae]